MALYLQFLRKIIWRLVRIETALSSAQLTQNKVSIEKYKSYFNFQKVKSKQKNTSIAIDSLKMTTEKKAVDLGLLEEDDEFEEFPAEGMLQP